MRSFPSISHVNVASLRLRQTKMRSRMAVRREALDEPVLHHLDGKATGGGRAASNLVCISQALHHEFHLGYMGGFNIPCTRSDFEAFLASKK